MFKHPLSIRLTSVVVGSATTLGMLALLAWSLHDASTKTLTNQIGRAMAVIAAHVQDKIERVLTERVRDVASVAKSSAGIIENGRATTQALLHHALSSGEGFEWLGVITPDMSVIAQSGASHVFDQAAQSPWIKDLLQQTNATTPLFRLIPPISPTEPDGISQRWYLELAAPIYSTSGKLEAVAVGIANWDWANSTVRSSAQNPPFYGDVELIITANDGRVLLAPAGHTSNLTGTEVFRHAQKEAAGWIVEPDLKGANHVVGFARGMGHNFFDGLGLTVLVRQNTDIALEPLVDLKQRMFWYMLLFAIHATAFHYILSGALTEPLLKIARAADNIRHTGKATIPLVTEFSETKTLSESLICLVDELQRREDSLKTLSTSLEAQVHDRTQALENKNKLLAAATAEVERAIEAKSRLLAAASHDLRQPLQALNLFCVALKRRVVEPEAAKLVDHLDQSLSSLRTMLDTLLHIARLDAGLVTATLAPLRLPELIDRLGAEFSEEADQRGLKFNFTCTDCYVRTDSALLETIVRNLLTNSFKFTKTGGVLLAARSRGKNTCIEIYDTGPGIEPHRLKTVFYEFERSRDQAEGPNDGLGLGLSIVERYSKLINATVAVRSAIGRGSRFSIEVPKLENHSRDAHKPGAPASAGSIADMNVMLVDDNSKSLTALSLDLSDRGAKIAAFDIVQEAIGAVEAGLAVDVAVIDYDLGDELKGIDLIHRWRREGRNFGAIILTGRTDAHTLSEISSSGVPWLTKPANPDSIAAAIERVSKKTAKEPSSRSLSITQWA